jgi:hypothetical protein
VKKGVPGLHVVLIPDEASIKTSFDLLCSEEGLLHLVKILLRSCYNVMQGA